MAVFENKVAPLVAATAAIFALIVLVAKHDDLLVTHTGIGGMTVGNPVITINGLLDVCYYDDSCGTFPAPGPAARGLAPRSHVYLNEMELMERDPFDHHIKRLYRMQGGCGLQYARDDAGKYITIWPNIVGEHGVLIDGVCAPGDPIRIGVNVSAIGATGGYITAIDGSCGLTTSAAGSNVSVALLLQGARGIGVDDSCASGSPVQLSFVPADVNVTEVHAEWFGAHCGVRVVEDAGKLAFSLAAQGENGINISNACPGDDAVTVAFVPADVDFPAAYDEWIVDGCGIVHATVAGDVKIGVNATGANGVVVLPGCGPGDPLALSFDPAQMDVAGAVAAWFGESCGTTIAVVNETAVFGVNIAGTGAIGVDDSCAPGEAVQLSFVPAGVNMTEAAAVWFGTSCGTTIDVVDGAAVFGVNIEGGAGVIVTGGCAPGDPLVVSWNVTDIDLSDILGACGVIATTVNDTTVAMSLNVTGENGVDVQDVCAHGDALVLTWDPALVNRTELVAAWYAATCGFVFSEVGGDIHGSVLLQGVNGVIVDALCAPGGDIVLAWDPSAVNLTDLAARWFASGCGVSVSEANGTITVSAAVISGPGVGVTPGCDDGDPLQLYFDSTTVNTTEFVDALFGATCGLTVVESGGEIALDTDLVGLNGITANQACLMGSTVFLSWDPALVNATAVAEQWFVSGCGATVTAAGGNITIAANTIAGPGIGVESGCGDGDPLQLYLDPSTANVTDLVATWFGPACGLRVAETGGEIALASVLLGTNGITIDNSTCPASPDVTIGFSPALTDVTAVAAAWFRSTCGTAPTVSAGKIGVDLNVTGTNGVSVGSLACTAGTALTLEFDPTATDVSAVNSAWFRSTCGTAPTVSAGKIGVVLNITGDSYINVDTSCPGGGQGVLLSLNVAALNLPNVTLSGSCLVYANASLSPAAEVVQTEGLLLSRIIAQGPCSNRRTHFYIDLPDAPLGFGMLVGKNNAFTGSGVRSSAVLGGEGITVAAGSQYVTVINGLNHVVNVVGDYGFIAGGFANQLDDDENFIGVARNSRIYAQGTRSTILGGDAIAVGPFSGARKHMLVGQGSGHVVTASYGTVLNGVNHQVLGERGFVLGGSTNINNAIDSGIAAGRNHVMGVLAERSIILAGDGVTLTNALDVNTAATQHFLATSGFRTSGMVTSSAVIYDLAYGSFLYVMTGISALVRLPATLPEGTQFVVRNNQALLTATVSCALNNCIFCDQGLACLLGGTEVLSARSSVHFLFVGGSYYKI